MPQLYPYRLTEFLHAQVGDGLRSVIYHDREGYEVVFVREDVDDFSETEIDNIVADLWANSYEQAIREDLRGQGPLNCSVWVFGEAIEMHFVADERQGVAVSLDTETFLAQNSFIRQCLGVAGVE
ncbi:hypothetical protein [Halorussus sp. MSC15.2]|uniref:DUF7522 family protein n=1 Tax=Halorussus sp. MSC15.2 TaxID=2283638 RepID=UPI0013CFAC0F|nr:hypothetical protein [Halorussus sp. MSC15.2]NEU56321.1 hypothetical protein [Halorussus sp. MSC15.2]